MAEKKVSPAKDKKKKKKVVKAKRLESPSSAKERTRLTRGSKIP